MTQSPSPPPSSRGSENPTPSRILPVLFEFTVVGGSAPEGWYKDYLAGQDPRIHQGHVFNRHSGFNPLLDRLRNLDRFEHGLWLSAPYGWISPFVTKSGKPGEHHFDIAVIAEKLGNEYPKQKHLEFLVHQFGDPVFGYIGGPRNDPELFAPPHLKMHHGERYFYEECLKPFIETGFDGVGFDYTSHGAPERREPLRWLQDQGLLVTGETTPTGRPGDDVYDGLSWCAEEHHWDMAIVKNKWTQSRVLDGGGHVFHLVSHASGEDYTDLLSDFGSDRRGARRQWWFDRAKRRLLERKRLPDDERDRVHVVVPLLEMQQNGLPVSELFDLAKDE